MRDRIYQLIRRSILTCEFEPGQELREQVLAERYRVSRSPVRDSLLRLEQENLVTVLPRQGYVIAPISIADAEDIFGLRLVIEPACTAAAARRDDAAVRTLDRFRGYANDLSDSAKFFEYNIALHEAVAELSGNARIVSVARDLAEQFDRLVRIILRDDPTVKMDILVMEHDAIIDAVQAHDEDAAYRCAYDHVADARLRIISLLGQNALTRDVSRGGLTRRGSKVN